jgi:hypothetical protein
VSARNRIAPYDHDSALRIAVQMPATEKTV